MPEDQRVVITNAVLPVTAVEPIPVKSAETLTINGTVEANILSIPRGYEYKAFYKNFNEFYSYIRPQISFGNSRDDSDLFFQNLIKWLEDGWEIHFIGDSPLPLGGKMLVMRRPR